MPMYVTKKRLSELFSEMQRTRQMSTEFYNVYRKMVNGIRFRYYTIQQADADEVEQDVLLRIWQNLDYIDPQKNVFSYLTQCIINAFSHSLRRKLTRGDVQLDLNLLKDHVVHPANRAAQVSRPKSDNLHINNKRY